MEEIIRWLCKLMDFRTAAEGEDAEACAGFICRTLAERGICVRRFTTEGGPRTGHHLLAEVPGLRPEAVLLHAHLDTADYGSRGQWRFPPQRATLRQDGVWGRGAIDCKGPLAVWMKLLADASTGEPRPYTLKLLVSDLEEQGGEQGLGLLLRQHPELLAEVKLAVGEGGGFPFPGEGETVFYTFQTGERETEFRPDPAREERMADILSMGIEKGYYARDILSYAARAGSMSGRKLDIRPLYQGMEPFFRDGPATDVYARFGPVFEAALRRRLPTARLMPCITPGKSDNLWLRRAGVPTAGFFPLDPANALGGIHGADEYVSRASLDLAYRVLSQALEDLAGVI